MPDDLKVAKDGSVSLPNVTRPPMMRPVKGVSLGKPPVDRTVSPYRFEAVRKGAGR